jgi:CBS domain-containing protein
MKRQVRDVMAEPVTVSADARLTEAARLMRDADIGDVVVVDGDRPRGLVTDRDIVVRAIAEDLSPSATKVGDICTTGLVSVAPADELERAAELMRQVAIRRLPVVDGDRLVGVISLGDLAIEGEDEQALADISAAEPNS